MVRKLSESSPRQVSVAALTATHPLYDQYVARWVQHLDLYEGQNLHRYIHKHARESIASHSERIKRLVYRNYCAPVVDLYLQYIFSKPTVRSVAKAQQKQGEANTQSQVKGLDAEWQDWLTNVDRRGTKVERFMTDEARWALVMGHTLVVVDMPSIKKKPSTEAERKAMRLRPYLVSYFPTEFTNWALDEDGKLEWARFREQIPEETDPFSDNRDRNQRSLGVADPDLVAQGRRSIVTAARYRTWTRDEWIVHEIKGQQVKEIDRGSHPLGEVPVVPFYNRRGARYPFVGESLLYDIGRLNVEILNQDSLIQEAVYQQTLNILVMGRQPDSEEEIVIGANNVMEYSGDKPPYFLSPSTAPVVFMEDRIQRMQQEIYRLAKLNGGAGTQPQSYQSGVALSFGFNETSAMLAEHADEFEESETNIHRLWMKWLGTSWSGTIDYPNEFDTASFQDDLQIVTTSKQAMRSPTFIKTLEKRAVRKILKTSDPELVQEIEREIDFIPEMVSTFTGPIYFDPMRQAVNNPQPTGSPVGVYGDLVQELGVKTEEQQKAEEDAQQQANNQERQLQHQKELTAVKHAGKQNNQAKEENTP